MLVLSLHTSVKIKTESKTFWRSVAELHHQHK